MDVEKLVREYIDKTVHMSLATTDGTKPWVCEVHFAYDDELNLYFRSLTSRRHSQEIAQNPNVAGNIVAQHSADAPVFGVYFEGTARQLPAGSEQQIAAACIERRLRANGSENLTEARNPEGHQFYKVEVNNFYIFGNFDDQGSKKYELKWNGGQK